MIAIGFGYLLLFLVGVNMQLKEAVVFFLFILNRNPKFGNSFNSLE
jgi:hypothetical protein